MQRRLAGSLLALSLFSFSPLAAAAMQYETASALGNALQAQLFTKQQTASIEMHGHFQKYYVSVWVQEKVQGRDLDMNATMNATIDFASEQVKGRAKLEIRIVNHKVYVMVDSINGNFDNEFLSFAEQFKTKKWFSFDLDQLNNEMQGYYSSGGDLSLLDQFLDVHPVLTTSGVTYELSLKREIMREIAKSLRERNWGTMFGIQADSLRRTPPAFSMLIKADADRNGNFFNVRIDASVTHPLVGFSLVMKDALSSGMLSVSAPPNAVDFTTLLESVQNPMKQGILNRVPQPYSPPAPPPPALEPLDDAEWQWEEPVPTVPSTPSPDAICPPNAGAAAVRRGLCHYVK